MNFPDDLQPGDCLLYGPAIPHWLGMPVNYCKDVVSFLIDILICIKTFSWFCHVEIYSRRGYSVASRNGIGVGEYVFRKHDLACVLRPYDLPDMRAMMEWFNRTERGKKYDWLGLFAFFLAPIRQKKRSDFCSEFAKLAYPRAGIKALAMHYPAIRTSPGMFFASPAFWLFWKKGADKKTERGEATFTG